MYADRIISNGRNRLGTLQIVGASVWAKGKKLAEALIRPLLEYGYEVVNMNKEQTKRVEQVMLKAGRLITGLPQSAMNDAVLGELGWCTMEERREIGKLKYFHRLRILPDNRLVKQIFIHRMKDAMEQKKKGSWCNEMFNIMNKYGIADQWNWKVNEQNNVDVWRWWNGNKKKEEEKREEEKNDAKQDDNGIKVIVEEKQQELWKERIMERK